MENRGNYSRNLEQSSSVYIPTPHTRDSRSEPPGGYYRVTESGPGRGGAGYYRLTRESPSLHSSAAASTSQVCYVCCCLEIVLSITLREELSLLTGLKIALNFFKHIPKWTVQRPLQEKNRNSTTYSHFKTNCHLKVHNVHLKLVLPISRKNRRLTEKSDLCSHR